ncbi:hypothetical protein ANCCAN_07854 [Ancylostoma caninum]|uniref:Paired domain-containing protein n=1 Tax=Ancylostoma caninum TaxID=29170 RepID=A0A368GNZ5_ANCCA|nr:hypothetical protein ANCCAN_07854 [Ancylostoma caninum]
MVRSSVHRSTIITLHQDGVSSREIARRLGLCRSVVFKTIRRFKDLGTSKDRPGRERPRSVTTQENVKKVREKIRRNPERSTRRMAQEMDISRASMRRIVGKHLGMKPYKKNRSHLTTEATKIKRTSVMVFAGITADGKTPRSYSFRKA